jgi:hypothetical protein
MKNKIRIRERKDATESQFVSIPSFVFRDRSVAVLECLVEYLKDERKLSFHEIAVLLNRNDRTVWTVYTRAKKKRARVIKHHTNK